MKTWFFLCLAVRLSYICILMNNKKPSAFLAAVRCAAVLIVIGVLTGCKNADSNSGGEATVKDSAAQAQKFRFPDIPDSLTSVKSRGTYMAVHFWDHFDFSDTSLVHVPTLSEQAYIDFIDVLVNVDTSAVQPAAEALFGKAAANRRMTDYFLSLSEKYLYNLDSPFRSDEIYIRMLKSYLKSPFADRNSAMRPEAHLESLLKNRMGTKAADFSFVTTDHKSHNLYSINSEYTLVYFNSPTCPVCHETLEQLKASPVITQAVADNKLAVLSVYPDTDGKLWMEHRSDMPRNWIYGWDEDFAITEHMIYSIRTLPSLYLLDKDKKVLLKETTPEAVERYIRR